MGSIHGSLKLIYGSSGEWRAKNVKKAILDLCNNKDKIWVPEDDYAVVNNLENLIEAITNKGDEGLPLIEAKRIDFGDGEFKVAIDNRISLRDSDVFYFLDIHTNDYSRLSKRVLESQIGLDTISGAKASRVTYVVPLFPYARQERRTGHEPQSARAMVRMYETLGADSIMTMDLHAPTITGFGTCMDFEHLKIRELFIDYIKKNIGEGDDIVLCAPDAGAGKITGYYVRNLNCELITGFKRRNLSSIDEIDIFDLPNIDCSGKKAIIIDDLISTGGTMLKAAKKLYMERGAEQVFAFATHPVMPGNAFNNFSNAYSEGYFHGLVVGDTVYRDPVGLKYKWFTTIDTSKRFAQAIIQKHIGGSVELLHYKDRT